MGPWLVEVKDRPSLEVWLGGGPPDRAGGTVMLVRGDEPLIRGFLPNALDAAKIEEDRVVVWIKDRVLFGEAEERELFGEGDEILAAVLSPTGTVGGWVTPDRVRVEDAAFAFAEAEEVSA
jgi:hypothetical protein